MISSRSEASALSNTHWSTGLLASGKNSFCSPILSARPAANTTEEIIDGGFQAVLLQQNFSYRIFVFVTGQYHSIGAAGKELPTQRGSRPHFGRRVDLIDHCDFPACHGNAFPTARPMLDQLYDAIFGERFSRGARQ